MNAVAGMDASKPAIVRAALLYEQASPQPYMIAALGNAGVDIVLSGRPRDFSRESLETAAAQVLVINLDSSLESHLDHLMTLLGDQRIPLVFNDAEATKSLAGHDRARWARHFAAKVTGRVKEFALPPVPQSLSKSLSTSPATSVATSFTKGSSVVAPIETSGLPADDAPVWILGASIGGPDAVREFAASLPANLPVCLVLAQHMDAEFLDLLAEQLDRATAMHVARARNGDRLKPGQIMIVPSDCRTKITPDLHFSMTDMPSDVTYRPCIDVLLEDWSETLGSRVNTIIFSGMASDGIKGAAKIGACGGTVWAQSAASCVVSSMADGARETGTVTFSGTPEQLAGALIERLRCTGLAASA